MTTDRKKKKVKQAGDQADIPTLQKPASSYLLVPVQLYFPKILQG